MNQSLNVRVASLAILVTIALIFTLSARAEPPRNLVILLGDGMGPAQVKAYRMFADDPATELVEPLNVDPLLVGAVSTDSIWHHCTEETEETEPDCTRDPYGFTDSASSATAYATGRDTEVGQLSVNLAGEITPTLLEAARMRGKATGMVATSEITHATPAAFASHIDDRNKMNQIADQYFDRQWESLPMVDVLLGGGLKHFQRENRDLVSAFRNAGYQVATNRQQLMELSGTHLLGLFAPGGLPRAWDRDQDTPSLAEMTRVSLQTLNRNADGFFLLVEGSQIDWASHDNSVPGVVSEMEDFLAAVDVVLEFARQHGDTLVVITADHETGGMSLGRDDIYRWDPRPLRGMTATPAAMIKGYLASKEALSAIVAETIPFELKDSEITALDATERTETATRTALATLFNQRTLTGWSSAGHTGVDVPLYVTGSGKEGFHGVMQNEALGKALWELFLPSDP